VSGSQLDHCREILLLADVNNFLTDLLIVGPKAAVTHSQTVENCFADGGWCGGLIVKFEEITGFHNGRIFKMLGEEFL